VIGGRVEAKLGRANNEVVDAKLSAQRVERLCEDVAGFLLVALRPQTTNQLCPADPSISTRGEKRDQRERSPTSRGRLR